MNADWIQINENETQMLSSGKALGLACQDLMLQKPLLIVIYLRGTLGAGKTTFVRGFLRGLKITDHIKSPTYTLVESYALPQITIHHFDLYRLKDSKELTWMGIDDYFIPHNICLIEWPEMGEGILPSSDLTCMIEPEGEGRRLRFSSHSKIGDILLGRLQHEE